MNPPSLDAPIRPAASSAQGAPPRLALLGNPNVGKTSLFNRLTNLLAKTSNYPGTTVELRSGLVAVGDQTIELIDLPGLYSLQATSPGEQVSRALLAGELEDTDPPLGIVAVVDATNLQRTLFIVREVKQLGLPVVVAATMNDLARKRRVAVDYQQLADQLQCSVVPISARTGEGLDDLKAAMASLAANQPTAELEVLADPPCNSCSSCPYSSGYEWAARVARQSAPQGASNDTALTAAADRWLTHRLMGPIAFGIVMLAVFASVFWIAQYPMNLLDAGMSRLADLVADVLPAGDLNSLLTQGVIGGVGGVLVFLPQICVLFFALSVLEDSGYLARAVLVVDRLMRKVGLPGQAFVPLLAAHACAIPAILATRVIDNRRDRLAAILVIPLMTCSARLPVYSMVAALLFPGSPLKAALLFTSAYALGLVAAFAVAGILRITLLPGQPSSLILDLPPYRLPSLGTAVRTALDRGWMFIRDAGTVILVISMAIWALSNYPKLQDSQLQAQVAELQAAAAAGAAGPIDMSDEQLDRLQLRLAQEHSLLGRAGMFVQPVFEPLGFDWKTSVGVLASFAAREVVVSTLSVLYETGDGTDSFLARVAHAKRADGTPAFDVATAVSLLVFFVLAMQCLPTQVVTRKETGSWKWAAFQFAYMSCLAYGAAFLAHQLFR